MNVEKNIKSRPQKKWVDYSHEVKLVESKALRIVLSVLSGVFLFLGLIGLLLPVMPTTPFVLVAAALYARSSVRFYNYLMNHPIMGPPLRDWRIHNCIRPRAKVLACSMLTITLGTSIIFFVPVFEVKIGLTLIGLSVVTYIATRKSCPKKLDTTRGC